MILPEGAILEGIYLYAGLPALFSIYATLYDEKWHDAAAILWILMAMEYFMAFGNIYAVIGIGIGAVHIWQALVCRKRRNLMNEAVLGLGAQDG